MEQPPSDFKGSPPRGFKLAPIQHLRDLESGSYWPQLRPYFQRPEFHRIRYTILGQTAQADVGTGPVSLRGASKAGELDVAFVADRLAAKMSITGPGLPDYCLTMVGQGNLVYSGEGCSSASVDPTCGLVYQGNPGTTLASAGSQERLAIWIPGESVAQRLAALMGAPARGDVRFQPVFDWLAPRSAALRQLIKLFMSELQSPTPSVLGSEAANRSFSDLLIYTMLRALPNNYSDEIARPRALATPGILRRAEAYMRAHVEEPIALHEVAQAAGCSVRSLQMAFRKFRETTPLLAIRQFRLEAAREALHSGHAGTTIAEVALRFGFANPGRFTRFYKAAFGEAPTDVAGRRF